MYIIIIILAVIAFLCLRYDLDYHLISYLSRRFTREEYEHDVEQHQSLDVETPFSRGAEYYDDYDKRLAVMREEILKYSSAPSNAIEYDGVSNIPHNVITMDVEEFPSIEEESEIGRQEIAR